MINNIREIILEEKKIIQKIKKTGQNKESIQQLIDFNIEVMNLLYQGEYSNYQSRTKIEKKEEKVEAYEGKDSKSLLQSKKIAYIANTLFGRISENMIPKQEKMGENLRKANIGVLLQTYLSIMIFFTLFSFILSILVYVILFSLNIISITYVWTILIPPLLSFGLFYSYPSSEASAIQKKISNELPFATIHMAAIAGSDMGPTQIFQIIAVSKEYSAIGKELKKVLTQVNIYGYDLLTSLINVAKTISNKKLSELLLGLATNISSGGSLKTYLEKKAETYLIDYKLEGKKYIDMAGTFMDIYISILIAAPLIMMLMFVIMSVADLNMGGMSLNSLLFLTVGIVVVLNIVFIFVLNLKQPAM